MLAQVANIQVSHSARHPRKRIDRERRHGYSGTINVRIGISLARTPYLTFPTTTATTATSSLTGLHRQVYSTQPEERQSICRSFTASTYPPILTTHSFRQFKRRRRDSASDGIVVCHTIDPSLCHYSGGFCSDDDDDDDSNDDSNIHENYDDDNDFSDSSSARSFSQISSSRSESLKSWIFSDLEESDSEQDSDEWSELDTLEAVASNSK